MADLRGSSYGSGEIKPAISWSSGNREVEWTGMVSEETPIVKKVSSAGGIKPPIHWSNANIQLEWIGRDSRLIEEMEPQQLTQDGLTRPEPPNPKEEMQPQQPAQDRSRGLEPPSPSEDTQPQRPNQDGLGEQKPPTPHKEKHKTPHEEKRKENQKTDQQIYELPSNDKHADSSSTTPNFSLYSYSEIMVATNSLSESSKVGKGGYGSVYKAKLRGTVAAVKMLDSGSGQGQKEFFRELDVLCQQKHANLVNLIGACFEKRALIYEFLPRGSLEDCLNKSPNLLTWQIRTRIVYDICCALKFLHSKSIVHGDLKPDNILLDANFSGKLTDFGLCRFLSDGKNPVSYCETNPKGTFAYIDLKFMETGELRASCDLYSFGVTILRLITRQPPLGLSRKVSDADDYAFGKMIDPTAGNWPFDVAKELACWALTCCYENEKSSEVMNEMWERLGQMSAKTK